MTGASARRPSWGPGDSQHPPPDLDVRNSRPRFQHQPLMQAHGALQQWGHLDELNHNSLKQLSSKWNSTAIRFQVACDATDNGGEHLLPARHELTPGWQKSRGGLVPTLEDITAPWDEDRWAITSLLHVGEWQGRCGSFSGNELGEGGHKKP